MLFCAISKPETATPPAFAAFADRTEFGIENQLHSVERVGMFAPSQRRNLFFSRFCASLH